MHSHNIDPGGTHPFYVMHNAGYMELASKANHEMDVIWIDLKSNQLIVFELLAIVYHTCQDQAECVLMEIRVAVLWVKGYMEDPTPVTESSDRHFQKIGRLSFKVNRPVYRISIQREPPE